jgi:hypothetical protein
VPARKRYDQDALFSVAVASLAGPVSDRDLPLGQGGKLGVQAGLFGLTVGR